MEWVYVMPDGEVSGLDTLEISPKKNEITKRRNQMKTITLRVNQDELDRIEEGRATLESRFKSSRHRYMKALLMEGVERDIEKVKMDDGGEVNHG